MFWEGYFHFLVQFSSVFEILVHPFSGQAPLSFLLVLVLKIWALVVNLGQRWQYGEPSHTQPPFIHSAAPKKCLRNSQETECAKPILMCLSHS